MYKQKYSKDIFVVGLIMCYVLGFLLLGSVWSPTSHIKSYDRALNVECLRVDELPSRNEYGIHEYFLTYKYSVPTVTVVLSSLLFV